MLRFLFTTAVAHDIGPPDVDDVCEFYFPIILLPLFDSLLSFVQYFY